MNGNWMGALVLAGAVVLPGARALAGPPVSFETDYVITVRGFTVGKAHFRGQVADTRFEVSGNLRSAGLARIFDKTEAKSHSMGTLGNGTPQPESFSLSYAQGDAGGKRMEIDFQDGDVARITHEPELGPPGDDVVPVKKSDLQSVTDPISATIVARGSAEEICRRTLRIYEGGTRVDVQLSPVSVGWVYGAGNGAVTCSASFIPVAGYIKSHTYDYMREHADMEFVYVPTHRQGIYMLHSISTRTDIGQVKLRAWKQKVRG